MSRACARYVAGSGERIKKGNDDANGNDNEKDEANAKYEDILDRYIELLNTVHPKRKVFYSDFFQNIALSILDIL